MGAKGVLREILGDDRLTRGLGDTEARLLIEWMVEWAEVLAGGAEDTAAHLEVKRLCRRGRAISRFVNLWCEDDRGGAGQLAAAERFAWPLPDGPAEPYDLMRQVLHWEGEQLARQRAA
jgi:hypothetical protein